MTILRHDEGIDLAKEDDAAGFLGIHIEHDP